MAKSSVVTLLTDFGGRDPYVAAMKGVILRADPRAQIVDLSHQVPAHDVLAGSFVLAEAAPHFPPGTLHVVVVDPGVGTGRSILVARFGDQRYLFPDNGVITFVADRLPLRWILSVRNHDYLPPVDPSMTFHGRDIFAPLAGRILQGLDPRKLGPQPESYKLLDLPGHVEETGAMVGQVIYIDHFGNLVTNLPRSRAGELWKTPELLHVWCRGRDVGPLQGTYAFVAPGETVALFNSMGLVEVAVNQGRACDQLDTGVGAEVRLAEAPPGAPDA